MTFKRNSGICASASAWPVAGESTTTLSYSKLPSERVRRIRSSIRYITPMSPKPGAAAKNFRTAELRIAASVSSFTCSVS